MCTRLSCAVCRFRCDVYKYVFVYMSHMCETVSLRLNII